MKDSFKNIDELLKESLEVYQHIPSTRVWKNISFRLLLTNRFLFWIMIPLAIIITGSILYLNSDLSKINYEKNTNTSVVNSFEIRKNTISESTKSSDNADLNTQDNNQGNLSKLNNFGQNTDLVENSQKESNTYASISNTPGNSDINIESGDLKTWSNFIHPFPGLPTLIGSKIDFSKPYYLKSIKFNQLWEIPSSIEYRVPNSTPKISKDDYGKQGKLWYGIYITPEQIFVNDENNSKNEAISFDASVIYTVKDWFLQAGVGIGLSRDNGTFRIDYAQYDSINYYNEVTSFTIDPLTGKPIFNTHITNVYDTVVYDKTNTTENLYTYLRIPVFAGYKIHEIKKFSVFLKAGVTYSVLINKNEPNTEYNNINATWVNITNETPSRIESNWQLSGGMGFSWKFGNKLNVVVEPVYSYYLNPVYKRNYNSKSTWSLGLRAGVTFKF